MLVVGFREDHARTRWCSGAAEVLVVVIVIEKPCLIVRRIFDYNFDHDHDFQLSRRSTIFKWIRGIELSIVAETVGKIKNDRSETNRTQEASKKTRGRRSRWIERSPVGRPLVVKKMLKYCFRFEIKKVLGNVLT